MVFVGVKKPVDVSMVSRLSISLGNFGLILIKFTEQTAATLSWDFFEYSMALTVF